jgi:murein DD-endopeptidase MepM/ murein hydrolase activator NlpD
MFKKISLILLISVLLVSVSPTYAQTQTDLPTYIVQSGDTLSLIAQRFGVPVSELINANGLADPNAIAVGMPLKIPGLEGISGTLITQSVPLGETFASMAARYQVSSQILARLNRVTSPQELFAGASLVLPQDNQKGTAQAATILDPGQSVLAAAAMMDENPWTSILTLQNNATSSEVPGNILFSRREDVKNEISAISPLVKAVQISPLPIIQGKTTVIRVQTTRPVTLTGQIAGKELHFFQEKDNSYVALQGIYALAAPGLTAFSLNGSSQDGIKFDFQEMLILKAGYYPNDPPLTVDPTTIDPAVTKPEEDLVAKVTADATPTKYWNNMFHMPVDEPVCYKSTFGNRRSYNGGPYNSFHGGTDFGVCANLNIYAAADGVVVFTGPLTVRGNATIIDHGWGVYSGYWHQKEIKVNIGDHVKAGQLIGLIGATGRVTGPHLHFEMMINGVQVEPVDWLQKAYP